MDNMTDTVAAWNRYLETSSDANLTLFKAALSRARWAGRESSDIRVHLFEATEHLYGLPRAEASAEHLGLTPTDRLQIDNNRRMRAAPDSLEAEALGIMADVRALYERVKVADANDDDSAKDALTEQMDALPFSIMVRSGWRALTEEASEPAAEYKLLLAGGGPTVEVRGDIEDGEATTAFLMAHEMGREWLRVRITPEDHEALLFLAQRFHYDS